MKRTRTRTTKPNKKADFILVSDLHLTEKPPVSRVDDYLEAQSKKLQFLSSLSEQNGNCPVLCSGDVFDRWKTSPWTISWVYKHLPRPFICVPGQHDLPGHSLEQFERSALHTLGLVDQHVTILKGNSIVVNEVVVVGLPFGHNPNRITIPTEGRRKILLLHELTWPENHPYWDPSAHTADELLSKFDEFDIILVGDNHLSFVRRKGGRVLVNPGSMLRITADQVNHRPRCFLYYADSNCVIPVHLPIQKNVFDTKHLERKKERDARISAYIEKLGSAGKQGFTLSFRRNLEQFFKANKVSKEVRRLILCHLED